MLVGQTRTVEGIRAELTSLVASLRPGILASMGCSASTGDLLTELGLTGWRLGVGSLRQAVDTMDSGTRKTAAVRELGGWLDREDDKERYRWGNAATAVRALDRALSTTSPEAIGRPFVDSWEANLLYVETQLELGLCGIAGPITDLNVRISDRLVDVAESRRVLIPLRRIALRPTAPLTHPWHHAEILADEDRSTLGSWLNLE